MRPPSNQPTLLLVDDTPDNVAVLFDFLSEKGFRVLVCESGRTALETLEIEEPDLILLDAMMPGLDGFETCRRLKRLPAGRDVPVFFMTALGEPYDKVRGLEAGAVDYLTKLVYPEEVLARIRAHLEIRQLQKTLQEQNDRLDAALQRSIVAEQALRHSLDEAVLVVDEVDGKILFSTERAQELIARHGGAAVFQPCLAGTVDSLETADGARIRIHRKPNSPANGTILVALVEEPSPASPGKLRSLGLTPRETEILFWIAQGKTSPEIAIILGMQVCTVKKHVENFLPKLGVETRLAAALRAQELLSAR